MKDIDQQDLERCRRGDAAGLEAVFEVFGDRVFRMCLSLLGQHADAEDAAQEVLLRILDKARSFAGRSSFSTWVYRVTVNHCLNRRKQGRSPASLSELTEQQHPTCVEPSPFEASARAEQREQLSRLLDGMRSEFRAVLVLREVEGLSYRECAEVLEIPLGTVMSRLARARSRLEALLEARRAAEPQESHS